MLTNNLNLPQAIVNAVACDPYDSGKSDISCTRLIAPARQVALQKKHSGEIVEDVSDRVWSLLGQSVHHILERAANEDDVVEERFYDCIDDWWISGQCDLISNNTLYDFKVTSVWSVLDGAKTDWVNQLNVLHYLADDPSIESLAIIAILRDWSRNRALKGNYPKAQVVEIDIPLWTRQEQEAYILERIRKHKNAQNALKLGQEIAWCTDEELWKRPDVFAVMKEGRKSAVKLCDTEEDAESRVENLGGKHYVEYRKGEAVRCGYCSVSEFCSQHCGGW